MKKVFVLRLDNEQIKDFVERQYPHDKGFRYSFYTVRADHHLNDFDYIRLSVCRNGTAFHESIMLTDFDVLGDICVKAWVKFMYEQFGDEYYEAYKAQVMSIFN